MFDARTLLVALVALAAASPATAQRLYKYTDPATGKVMYSDKPPIEATGKASEQLNKQGTVVKRTDAAPTPEQLAAREAERKKKLEDELAAKEEKRKNTALLNTYLSEKDIDEARTRALKANEDAIKETEHRIALAEKRQKQLASEAEFYKKGQMPVKLKQDIQTNETDLRHQTELLETKRREFASINAKYDEDKRRYLELTKAGATGAGPSVATAASNTVKK